jgi:hypothetical protein
MGTDIAQSCPSFTAAHCKVPAEHTGVRASPRRHHEHWSVVYPVLPALVWGQGCRRQPFPETARRHFRNPTRGPACSVADRHAVHPGRQGHIGNI